MKKAPIRLNKFLSQRGGVSRREAERLIAAGKLTINGERISSGQHFVDPEKDNVFLSGRKITKEKPPPQVLMFNKPPKVLSAVSDPKGRPLVMDYIKEGRRQKPRQRLFPVGRLDWDSEGLLLLSNEGDFANKVLHPKHKTFKSYLIKVRGRLEQKEMRKLLQGVSTPVGKKKALFARRVSQNRHNSLRSSSWAKLIIHEGKKRQIRWMFERMGFPVQKLKRTAIGRLKLSKLPRGNFRPLDEREIRKIFQRPKELNSSYFLKGEKKSLKKP